MLTPIRVGIAGLGTVGIGVINIISNNLKLIEQKTGRSIKIVAVSARSKEKQRGLSLERYDWVPNPIKLAQRDDIDIFVELIGGDTGVAKKSVETAISAGKNVVTANKALLAIHGGKLAKLSEKHNVLLKFEAAVAGGIPVIKVLNESVAINKITRVMGVMNGSCNYILTRMEESNLSYSEIFSEAEKLGYLESDPKLDVGGIDSAHKLAILSSLAFGTVISFSGIKIQGIEEITVKEIQYAADMGFRVKLLGIAEITSGGLVQTVAPCLVPKTSPLSQLEGGINMIVLECSEAGTIVLQGPGAGREPTASSVVSDIIDIARNSEIKAFGRSYDDLEDSNISNKPSEAPYFISLLLDDKLGALARVTTTLGNKGISINRMRQYDHDSSRAPVLIITHSTSLKAVTEAITELPKTGVVSSDPVILRIEE